MHLGHHAHRVGHPAHERFVQNAERQHVQAAQLAHLPPRQRRLRIGQDVVRADRHHLAQFAEIARLDELPHDAIGPKSERTGNDLSD
jgi:hypothetical protein